MSMEVMRDLLKGTLGRSLQTWPDEEKLAVAWTVACGKAMAEHGSVMSYAEGIVRLEVTDEAWLRQMMGMKSQLARELARIAGVRVREIHFELKRI